MSYGNSWKEGEGDFLLVVSGTIRYAPYLVGWQEFKDHLRKVVKEQPGWADVYSSQGQRRGEMQGWCRLKDREDADAVYKVSYRAKGMLVHVWETNRKGEGYRLMRCNCSTLFPELPEGGHSIQHCGIDIGRVHQLGGSRGVSTTSYNTAQSKYMCGMYPQMQGYAPQPSVYAVTPVYALPTPPVYSTTTNGVPVNVRGGALLTEARGIFIRNLSYQCTLQELSRLLLDSVGYPIDVQFLRDGKTGVFKGVATAKFASKEMAQHAVNALNGTEHMGLTLQVRMDVDTTIVGQAEPMVVNGSYAVSWVRPS